MSKIDIIIERLKSAPPGVVEEVLALIERRTAQRPPEAAEGRGVMRYFGRLKESKAFEGDPVDIQRALRDEWD